MLLIRLAHPAYWTRHKLSTRGTRFVAAINWAWHIISVSGAFAYLSLVLHPFRGFFSPSRSFRYSVGHVWLTKKFHGTRYQFKRKKVKFYTGSHQRAWRKGSQLVLALARAPPKDEKEKQQRLLRIRRVVSYAIRPAPRPPEARRSTSKPPSRSSIITVAVVKVYFVSCLYDYVKAFYCMAV